MWRPARLGAGITSISMNEKQIFRNIQHIPKVWGVTYLKLFATLGLGLVVTTIGFSLTSAAMVVVKILVIGLGIVLTSLIYGICFWIDNTDRLERDSAAFLKPEMNSQSLSLQELRFLDQEGMDAVSRPDARH